MRRRSSIGKSAELVIVKVAVLGITLLCSQERHITLISQIVRCVVWKTNAVSQRYLKKKNYKKTNKKNGGHGSAGISEPGSGQQLPRT